MDIKSWSWTEQFTCMDGHRQLECYPCTEFRKILNFLVQCLIFGFWISGLDQNS